MMNFVVNVTKKKGPSRKSALSHISLVLALSIAFMNIFMPSPFFNRKAKLFREKDLRVGEKSAESTNLNCGRGLPDRFAVYAEERDHDEEGSDEEAKTPDSDEEKAIEKNDSGDSEDSPDAKESPDSYDSDTSDSSDESDKSEGELGLSGSPSSGKKHLWQDLFDGRKGKWPSFEQVLYRSYIVIDADTGETIIGDEEESVAYPASMTKILTCITVLEHPDYAPERPVKFSARAVAMPCAESSTCGYVAGEETATLVALYAMMIQSANEVANALGETYGGSIDGFAQLMNAKAKEIGCKNTHFVDPAGFGLEDHVTTARDMAEIVRYAMKNDVFRDIVNTRCLLLPATNIHPYNGWRTIFNGNGLVDCQDAGYQSDYFKSIDGVKPGATDIAGYCLASAASTYDGRRFICILFDARVNDPNCPFFVNASVLSYVILQEAAKKAGCPKGSPDYSEKDYKLAWAVDPATVYAKAEAIAEEASRRAEFATESKTTQTTLQTSESINPTGKYVPDSSIVFKPIQLILLIFIFFMLLVLTAVAIKLSAHKKLKTMKALSRQTYRQQGPGAQGRVGPATATKRHPGPHQRPPYNPRRRQREGGPKHREGMPHPPHPRERNSRFRENGGPNTEVYHPGHLPKDYSRRPSDTGVPEEYTREYGKYGDYEERE